MRPSRDSLWSSRSDPAGVAQDAQEVIKMRRIRLVVAVAATMLAMLAFSVPAMADVDFDGDRHDWREGRIDRYEDRVDGYYDAIEDAYEDGFFYYNPFVDVDDIEDYWDIID
jgi:hypothetical protein